MEPIVEVIIVWGKPFLQTYPDQDDRFKSTSV